MLRQNMINPQQYMPMHINNSISNQQFVENQHPKPIPEIKNLPITYDEAEEEKIDIKYIIKNKPSTKIVREFF